MNDLLKAEIIQAVKDGDTKRIKAMKDEFLFNRWLDSFGDSVPLEACRSVVKTTEAVKR